MYVCIYAHKICTVYRHVLFSHVYISFVHQTFHKCLEKTQSKKKKKRGYVAHKTQARKKYVVKCSSCSTEATICTDVCTCVCLVCLNFPEFVFVCFCILRTSSTNLSQQVCTNFSQLRYFEHVRRITKVYENSTVECCRHSTCLCLIKHDSVKYCRYVITVCCS